MMLIFSLRRLLRHWSTNLPVLVGLTLAATFLAGMPVFANAAAEWSLQQSFENIVPSQRNIEISAAYSKMTGALYSYVIDTIGDLIQLRLTVQQTVIGADAIQPIVPVDDLPRQEPNRLLLWSFDNLAGLLQIVQGSFPEYSRPYTPEEIRRAMSQAPRIQAAISSDVASETGIQLGDLLLDSSGIEYLIVGVIEPKDPQSDVWWGDPTTFQITRQPGVNEDTIYIPLIISPLALQEFFPDYNRSWRLVIDRGKINQNNSQFWEENFLSLKTRLQTDRVQITSDLPNLLLTFRNNQSTIRMVLLLLGSQSLIFVLYTLALTASAVLEHTQGDISTMVGRGASIWQLIRMLAIEWGYLTLLAGFLLGPLAATLALKGWALVTGSTYVGDISAETLTFSLLGAGLGWITLMLSAIPMVRRNILEWRQRLSRADRINRWTKLYLDVFLVILGAVIFWQLSSNGSFVVRRMREVPLADPLLLLSPTILLIAASMILLRIFPYIVQGIAWLVRSSRGLVLSLGLSRLSRNPVRPNQIVLLIGVAFSMLMFMSTYDNSLGINQREIAHYLSGADLRIAQANLSQAEIAKLPGVNQVSQVLRLGLSTNSGRTYTLLAIDSQTFAKIANYPTGMTYLSMEAITRALQEDGPANQPEANDSSNISPYPNIPDPSKAIPAIYSRTAIPGNKGIGDTLQINIQVFPIDLSVRGVITEFPTVTKSFILVDISALQTLLDLNTSSFRNNQEIWLAIDPVYHDSLVRTLSQKTSILADARQELLSIQNNAFTEGARRAFTLNAYTLACLSIVAFILLNYFSAQQRRFEFGILRANGMSVGQVITLLVTDGMVSILLGLAVGIGIGIGLIHSMRVFLNTALMQTFPAATVFQINIDWFKVGMISGLLVLSYILATLVFVFFLVKSGIHQVIKIGEE
ncbi:MAG: FtsX-like permease family protein [Anaerolineales bacterium]